MDREQAFDRDSFAEPSYYALIPYPVITDPDIPDGAKLLYGRITMLTKRSGYCYASNEYLASELGKQPDTISKLVKKLKEAGYIHTEVIRDPDNKKVVERRIYPIMSTLHHTRKNFLEGTGKKSDTPPGKKSQETNGTLNDGEGIPPTPQGEAAHDRDGNQKRMPKHKPDRFQAFWEYYPRHDDRDSAVRAWDRLKPSDETIRAMAKALVWQKKLPQWADTTKIPYACRWLKNRRWLDERPNEVSAVPLCDPRGGLQAW